MLEIIEKQSTLHGTLGPIFNQDKMYEFVFHLIDDDLNVRHGTNVLDFGGLTNISAGGICALSNVIELIKRSGAAIKVENTGKSSCFKKLRDFGFISNYVDKNITSEKNLWHNPLHLLQREQTFSYLEHNLIPWIASGFNCHHHNLDYIKSSLTEIFNNVFDHSTVDVFSLCAYNDLTKGELKICVSDFGVGIPTKIKNTFPELRQKSDLQAIAKALEDGFTSKTSPRNRGAGLHLLCEWMVGLHSGVINIHSNRGIYRISKNEYGQRLTKGERSRHTYPGTMIVIDLQVAHFLKQLSTSQTEEFEW